MLAVAPILGYLKILGPVLVALDKALEAAGLDDARRKKIVDDLITRLKGGSGRPQDLDVDLWEYSVITLVEEGPWRKTPVLVPKLRDGVEVPEVGLASYLNQTSKEGWEILSVVEGRKSSTLLLYRSRPLTELNPPR